MPYKETKTYLKFKDKPATNKPQYIVVHHTGGDNGVDTSNQTAQIVEEYHLGLGWEGIGYQFYIEKDGDVWRGRPEHYHGAHVKEDGMNKKSIGICLAGNFDVTLPVKAQTDALVILMKEMMDKYKIPIEKVFPHRHYALNTNGSPYKTCYGSKLPDTWARDLLAPSPGVDSKEATKKEIIRLLNTL